MSVLCLGQRTLTVEGEGSLYSRSPGSLHTKNLLSLSVKSSLVELETSCTVILPPAVSVLCLPTSSVFTSKRSKKANELNKNTKKINSKQRPNLSDNCLYQKLKRSFSSISAVYFPNNLTPVVYFDGLIFYFNFLCLRCFRRVRYFSSS